MKSLTALGKKPKGLGALGSNFINEFYVNSARNQDFMGMPEKANPDYAPERKPYKDPLKFKVVESDHFKAVRKQLQWVAEFRNHVDLKAKLDVAEISQPVPRYVPFLEPLPAQKTAWEVDAKAEGVRHAEWIAKERADMVERRLAHLLQGI